MTEEELLEKGYRKYTGKDVDVFFNAQVCIHSGVCVRGNHAVFDLERKPWILPDNDEVSKVTGLIDQCPSGALQYVRRDNKA